MKKGDIIKNEIMVQGEIKHRTWEIINVGTTTYQGTWVEARCLDDERKVSGKASKVLQTGFLV